MYSTIRVRIITNLSTNINQEVNMASTASEGLDIKSVTFEITVPDLRNGALANIQQAAVRAGMQALYYWPIITGLDSGLAVDAAEHSYRAHVTSLQTGFGPERTTVENEQIKQWAIVLAGVRAGAQAAWRLTEGDITRKEVRASGMEIKNGKVMMSATGDTASAKWTAARSVVDMTKDEMDMLAMCVYMGMAVPVLQGASLITTGHHYVPSTYQIFRGLKRQALGAASKEVGTIVESMGERFDDLAFHKACHPISPDLKRELAIQTAVADKLSASGHGSAAIRLPAIPSEATGGKAALALIKAAERVMAEMGDTISADTGLALMRALEDASAGEPRAKACNAVVEWVESNSRILAVCAGIVQHVHDNSGTGKNTLLSAYSVQKLMRANPAEVSKGVIYAKAANAKMKDSMEKGEYKLGMMQM